jgi:ubiquinone/menaquinone biosynthesis C-methylase UbiE
MPELYNRLIHWSQYLALRRWIRIDDDQRVLDVGCGVGRWSLLLAKRGARVVGVDLSPTMIAEAQRRAGLSGVQERCGFMLQDLAQLDANERFDLLLGVTVLQHILDVDDLRSAVRRMADHLTVGGRMVLLEAAPSRLASRCDTSVFRARERSCYLQLFTAAGLELVAINGVDPAPFKTWLLPHLRRLPPRLARLAIMAVTACSAPIDLLFGRRLAAWSWHAVFVLRRAQERSHVA